MKKFIVLFLITTSLFAKQSPQDRLLRNTVEKTLPQLSKHSCRYIKGRFIITKSDTQYFVNRGYLLCALGDNILTAFEYSVEEEDSAVAVNIGDIMISPLKR